MKLLIISDMSHYMEGNQVLGWGPTVQEIDQLASLFEKVRHVGCLYENPPPETSLAYSSHHITFIPVPPAGGSTLLSKARIIWMLPRYFRAILQQLPWADVVHVRCPANISLLAVVLLAIKRLPSIRWVKYAGNWGPEGPEALSYRFQRWWLRKGYHRGVVTVNGRWPNQPGHVHSFSNPCLTDQELVLGRTAASGKTLTKPIRLTYAGRLESEKGVGRALKVLSALNADGFQATLDLAGDGRERSDFERQAAQDGVNHLVRFHGWLPRTKLNSIYAQSHFFLMPCTSSEGWPKVLSESMAYGVVPLAGNLSSIPQLLKGFRTGRAIPAGEIDGYYRAILEYSLRPELWKSESDRAVEAAAQFTYSRYLDDVNGLIRSVVAAEMKVL
jgi:glycosyltransferase involved in cell wall biosynthesis